MSNAHETGIVVYGATGYTGKLVAEYLNSQYGVGVAVPWAIAGRSEAKLAAVRDDLGIAVDLPLVVADASDPDSLRSMVERARVIITTVGPYQLYGSDLVAACAPRMMEVRGEWFVRGGISTEVRATHVDPGWRGE